MEEKKKSTIGKAFSRTFGRKSTTPQASTPAPAAAPITVAAPVAAPATAPIAAPVAPPVEKPIEAASNGALAPPHSNGSSNGNPFSPISIATPNMTTISPPDSSNISRVASPTHDSPKSPINSSMHMRDGTAMSNSSTMSRHGLSGEDGEGLNPADILMNRLVAFRSVIKNLQQYYTEVAQVETGVSKAMHKASGVITVPFKDGQQFLGKGGLQDVCAGIRDSAKLQSDQHASAARFVEETIVKNLRRLKQDIKGKIKALKSDTSLYSNRVFKERELTQEKIATLAKAIGLFDMSGQHQPDMEKMQSDPFIINLALRRQLAKQIHEENLFARALRQCQEEIATFEAHIIKETKQILASYSAYQLTNGTSTAFSQAWASTDLALNVLQENSEWTNFLERNGHRLFPSDLVDANPDDIDYPCKDSPYVLPIKTAHMSRQSSVLKSWKDGYFVLTLAGWVHVFGSADHAVDAVPDQSIYIPTSTLGPHTEAGQKQHVFSLGGKGKGGLLHRDTQTFTLRAHSREEMVEWWSEISKRAHSSTYTQPGDGSLEAMSRSGSVMRSSSVMGAKSPELAPAALPAGPSPPYVAQAQHDQSHDEKAVHAAAAPVTPPAAPVTPPTAATPAASSPAAQPATLERTDTGSTASLKAVEPAPAAAPAVVPPTQA
ncbi:hypothetical protein BGZ74_001069 [Mortierella antarctica]|nr:hypothetical protein BGZ74_001069 [Mortierella antarctica]